MDMGTRKNTHSSRDNGHFLVMDVLPASLKALSTSGTASHAKPYLLYGSEEGGEKLSH